METSQLQIRMTRTTNELPPSTQTPLIRLHTGQGVFRVLATLSFYISLYMGW